MAYHLFGTKPVREPIIFFSIVPHKENVIKLSLSFPSGTCIWNVFDRNWTLLFRHPYTDDFSCTILPALSLNQILAWNLWMMPSATRKSHTTTQVGNRMLRHTCKSLHRFEPGELLVALVQVLARASTGNVITNCRPHTCLKLGTYGLSYAKMQHPTIHLYLACE